VGEAVRHASCGTRRHTLTSLTRYLVHGSWVHQISDEEDGCEESLPGRAIAPVSAPSAGFDQVAAHPS
jgi:hypothetical protein